MPDSPTHFTCDRCGKRYAWKAELAGKRAKCACGETLTVPAGIAPTPAEPDELYDFAEPEVKPKKTVAAVTPSVVVAPNGGGGAVLNYSTGARSPDDKRAKFDDFYHAPRDFYWPTGVLAVGFVALMAWALTAGASGAGLFIFSAYITVATVIKTVVMIGAAFVIAPMAGVSFGTFWTAVLKLAAIVVITDAALFWLQEIMEYTGAYPVHGTGRRSWAAVGMVNTLLAGTIIALLLKIFFDMDREDVGHIAVPLAILNRVLNLIIILILAAILGAIKSAVTAPARPGAGSVATAASPAAPPKPPPTAVDLPPQPANADVAKQDAFVETEIIRKPFIQDAFKYFEDSPSQAPPANALRDPRSRMDPRSLSTAPNRKILMAGLRQTGTRAAYVEIARDADGYHPTHLIVEMPYRSKDRAKVIELLKQQVALEQVTFDTAKALVDQGNKYMMIPLRAEAAGKR